MHRRTFVAAVSATAMSPFLRFPATGNLSLAQSTPVGSPEPSETEDGADPPVARYQDISAEYALARNNLLTLGRPIVDQLMGSDPVAVYNLLSPSLQALVPLETLATFRPTLETNRVHFELTEFAAIFDGHLAGQRIEGFFSQNGVFAFGLTAEDAATGSTAPPTGSPTAEASLEGQWTGQIATGDPPLAVAVTFRNVDGALSGTIDIPAQGMTALPLENVSFVAEKPIGDRDLEFALPHSPGLRYYIARYPWDNAALTLTAVFDASGGLLGLTPDPEWPLPPDPAADLTSEVTYQLPFDGVWWTFSGGESLTENYHASAQNQRHALDLLIWKDGGTFRGDGSRNEDYWAWGQPLYAPAAGTVVVTLADLADNVPGTLNPEPHPAGNHIVLQTAENEFVFLAHIQQGGVQVQPGDQVTAGQLLAFTGNSGNSSEPHLYIHVQDQIDFFSPSAIGLPLIFTGYRADGVEVATGTPTRGQLISP